MSMANADVEGEKHIIVGVNHKANGERDIVGIEKETFIDASIYQQLIRENIEPYIKITYEPYEYTGEKDKYKGDLVGVFKIEDCNDKPYMMKKKYRNLNKGDAFIRKGTHQTPITRTDLDKIYDKKGSNDFEENIKMGFIDTEFSNRIKLSPLEISVLPSERAADEIERILEEKRNSKDILNNTGFGDIHKMIQGYTYPFSSVPYKHRSIERLEKDLENVKETYRDYDLYEVFSNSYVLNFEVINEDRNYIEDASFRLEIPDKNGIIVFDKYYEEPSGEPLIIGMETPTNIEVINYPDIYKEEDKVIVDVVIGNIKHHIPIDIYDVSFRIWIKPCLKGETIELKGILYGKNLVEPIERSFFIDVK
jgi:hypothetical protein